MDERERLTQELLRGQRRILQTGLPGRLDPVLDNALTLHQLKLLLIVYVNGESSMRSLAHAMNVSLPTVSEAVERLIGRGLATRREDPSDRRVRLVSMSRAGRRLAQEIEAAGDRFSRELLDELDLDTLRALLIAHRGLIAATERLAQRRETLGDPGT